MEKNPDKISRILDVFLFSFIFDSVWTIGLEKEQSESRSLSVPEKEKKRRKITLIRFVFFRDLQDFLEIL